jgi:superfamily II DNA or RNA helicase
MERKEYESQILKNIPDDAQNFDTLNKTSNGINVKPPSLIELRRWGRPFVPLDFQKDIIQGLYNETKKRSVIGLLSLPTGSGKTLTTCSLVLKVLEGKYSTKKCALWIAPQRELLYQASEAFQAAWWSGQGPSSLDIKMLTTKSSFKIPERPTCFLLTPNLAIKIMPSLKKCSDIAIFDEAHHAAAEVFNSIWDELINGEIGVKNLLSLGLSATPDRENTDEIQILQHAFGNNLFVPEKLGINPIKTLIQQGVLSKPIFQHLDQFLSFAKFRGVKDKRSMQSLLLDKSRWDCIIDSIVNRTVKGQTVIYCLDKLHGSLLTKHLRYLGKRAEFVDGSTPFSIRNGIFERFRNKDTEFLINVKLLIEGVDCPAAENIILTYPTQAQIRLHQMIGRVLRGPMIGGTLEGKVYAMEGSQTWLDRILYRGDFRLAGWNVISL